MRFTALTLVLFAAACASAPPAASTIAIPVISWEQKLGWMMRLEDQRLLRDPNPPARRELAPATATRAAVVAPPEPSDILPLLTDPEARVRRRAALAAGRAGLEEAVEPLVTLLRDEEFEVRQVAAFALGLLGRSRARPALVAALSDPHPVVQGRAAEALGRLAARDDAAAVAAMVRAHLEKGALKEIMPDDESAGQLPADAVRLGLVALGGLGSFDALASVALGQDGIPISSWWPFAYALQRSGDPRAVGPLRALLVSSGRYSRTLAIQGLGLLKAGAAVPDLLRVLTAQPADQGLAVESVRALRRIGDAQAAPALLALAGDGRSDPSLRLEALDALGSMPASSGIGDALLDLLSERDANVRAAAFLALAQLDPDAFVSAIAGLEPDTDWTVRAAQAEAIGRLPAERALPALMGRLNDPDQRVVAPVLKALAATGSPEALTALLAGLKAEDLVVRAEAARGLGAIRAASAARALAEAIDAWKGDPQYVARVAALEALARIDPAAAAPILRAALGDRDWAVRVRVAELLAGSLPAGGSAEPSAEVVSAIRPAPSSREIPPAEWAWLLAPPFSPHVRIEMDRGIVELELDVIGAPQTVANFMSLARRGFFDGVPVHRVVTNFVVQGGDPRGDGEGGPGYTIRDEPNLSTYGRGTVGMALDWRDTGGSQFFVTLAPQPQLDGRYTAFGRVVEGMEVVDGIRRGDVVRKVSVWDGRSDP
ncbi:MAG: HEAT repeat domain-containing protein [Vicinamibacterales bacterium]|nr:HEAT repeat domain-containing protein [Vicinamibacterales bacterium]